MLQKNQLYTTPSLNDKLYLHFKVRYYYNCDRPLRLVAYRFKQYILGNQYVTILHQLLQKIIGSVSGTQNIFGAEKGYETVRDTLRIVVL